MIIIIFLICLILFILFLLYFRSERLTIGTGITISTFSSTGFTTIIRRLTGNNGKIAILIHNSPFNYEVWASLYSYALRQEKYPTLYSYDIKGHGTAWQPEANISSIKELALDLYNLYSKYIKSDRVIIVGYGFGGAVAQEFALDYPEAVEALYILQMITKPISNLDSEIQYLENIVSSRGNLSYITLDNKFIQYNLCKWFPISNKLKCPYIENSQDTEDFTGTTEYLLAQKLFREANAETLLATDQILTQTDFSTRWANTKVSFPITMVLTNNDLYMQNTGENELKTLQQATQNAKIYIVSGKHGFTLVHPDYVFKLLQGQDLSTNSETLKTLK